MSFFHFLLFVLFVVYCFVDSIMAASASVANNPHFKIDRCSPLWKHVQMIRPMSGVEL